MRLRTLAISLLSSACVLAGLAWPRVSQAQLIFQTTFNCPGEWTQSNGLSEASVCASGDGIAGNGSWQTSPGGSQDQITTPANFAGGGGGRGFRHWVGSGLNNVGGGITVNFGSAPEIWLRYYIRFQSGFSWGSPIFMKTIYCNRGSNGTFYFGLHSGFVGGHLEDDPANLGVNVSNVTWAQFQGGSTGDGNFHALEVHAKMNTTATSSDGVFEFWLDGNPIYSNTSAHFSNVAGARFTDCAFGENSNNPQNASDVFVDFDDIAVSSAGYIGPLGPAPFPAPRNLRVQ